MHRCDGWRSPFLQMPAHLGNYYHQIIVHYLSIAITTYNCGFTRWVDPAPIDPHQEYIEHLQNRIFELEAEVSAAAQEEDDGVSPQQMCTIPNCSCPVTRTRVLHRRCHRHQHHMQRKHTMEKVQHNMLGGRTTRVP